MNKKVSFAAQRLNAARRNGVHLRRFSTTKTVLLLALPLLLLPGACIQTEIVPEVLEPRLSLSATDVSLVAGTSTTLSATYTDAQNVAHPELVQWLSRNPAVATVSGTGVVSAVGAGQAWVVATAPGNLADSALVTVVQNSSVVARVDVSGLPAMITVGQTATLQARAFNMNNVEIPGQTFTWVSSNPAVLQVTGNVAEALSPGTASVRAATAGVQSLPANTQVLPVGGLSRSGSFSGNSGYSVKGTATLTQSPNGLLLGFGTDFLSGNGPMLGVYLAKTPSGALTGQNSVKLGNLIANSGSQTYTLSNGAGLYDYDYVVIYCIPFNVRFGTAMLN